MELNKGDVRTIFWWFGWIGLTIVTFFVSAWFWTGFLGDRMGGMDNSAYAMTWVAAVFGSWMVLLVPLIVLMYNKVDKAYEDARITRETKEFDKAKKEFKVRAILVEEKSRLLKPELTAKLKMNPETVRGGHLVTAILKDGRRVENVFVAGKKDVLGVYGVDKLTFAVTDIVDVVPAGETLPDFETDKWLRLDGVGTI
jgi:uncharacterized membrane protein